MTGLSRLVIEALVAELAPRWQARHHDRLAARTRRRGIGAGAIGVQVLADAGYQGLGTDTAGAVITPRPKPRKGQKSLPRSVIAAHDAARKRHSSQRIRVEHVIGHLKNWRILARYHGRREHFDATIRAIAGLLSDHQHTDRTDPTTRQLKALPATAHYR
ncbi:transposase family protein [Micromonospora sp. 4G55]|uniref:transposase family protein n=1 Tax=Micromonospora sp. 4G55 TaxID=2806102 RepID=UPI00272EB40B|nr:transposase family protein [Micromonospora sp. 4G55]